MLGKRYSKYCSFDPFPQIPSSLLNSADISDYVSATGMIFPFDEKRLKPASYGLSILGKCIYWDSHSKKVEKILNEGDEFILQSDSIAFVTLDSYLQFPYYIAARFNLKINHVYKGLLLGTGPLIDPGYEGHLSIPLHNLTTNDYTFRGGETMIWMEFTKLSPNVQWQKEIEKDQLIKQKGVYQFYEKRKIRDVNKFIAEAEPHRPVQSSIPLSVAK